MLIILVLVFAYLQHDRFVNVLIYQLHTFTAFSSKRHVRHGPGLTGATELLKHQASSSATDNRRVANHTQSYAIDQPSSD